VRKFLIVNQISGDVQSINDTHLYKILTTTNMNSAISAITSVISIRPTTIAPTVAPSNSFSRPGSTTMQQDSTYAIVVQAYNPSVGLGNRRNTAIVIVGNFMRLNGLTGDARSANDTQLLNILISSDIDAAKAAIAAAIPAIIMRQDANYQNVILSYNPRSGFDHNRKTAIAIMGKFMSAHNLNGSPTRFTDAQLYNILSATSIPLGIRAINIR
jgi:hypothetical protein